ncbi:MAG: SUMF1/EgtB/PvdO family nonheme iron enzyme [Pseudomonadota bacterium]
MAHVCILYAIDNQAFASKIEAVLFEMGHIVSRREVDDDTCAYLGAAEGEPDAMIVIWSGASIASPLVISEARGALARRALTPLSIGKVEPPASFQHLWPIDLSGWGGAQDDPRWRFVTDEINLSIRRSEAGYRDNAFVVEPRAPSGGRNGPSARAVFFGGAVALSALTISAIGLAPFILSLGDSARDDGPTVAFVEPSVFGEASDDATDAAVAGPTADGQNAAAPVDAPFDANAAAANETDATGFAQTPPDGVDAPADIAPASVDAPTDELQIPDAAQNGSALQDDSADQAPAATTAPATAPQTARTDDETAPQILAAAVIAAVEDEGVDAVKDGAAASTESDGVEENGVEGDGAAPTTFVFAAADEAPTDDNSGDASAEDAAEENEGDGGEAIYAAPSLKPAAPVLAAVAATANDNASGADAIADLAARSDAPDAEGLDRLIVENVVLAEEDDFGPARDAAPVGVYFRDCLDCPDMAEIDGGVFVMGTPLDETSRAPDEFAPRSVSIDYRYALSAREITFKQWDACVADGGCNGYRARDPGWGRGDRPVVNVSLEDARAFASWLSAKTGAAYRLPNEAEWEFAARAGAATPFSFGLELSTRRANYYGQYAYNGPVGVYRRKSTPAGSFAPNALGLYDMHGNVWEWTDDCWATDATPAADCGLRVLKGGAWNTGGWRLRAGHRIAAAVTERDFDKGFRVARTLP